MQQRVETQPAGGQQLLLKFGSVITGEFTEAVFDLGPYLLKFLHCTREHSDSHVGFLTFVCFL